MFTSNTPISKGFTSLIPALETFKAFNWKDFPNIKLINNCNINVLVKYKKLKIVKCFSFLSKVIIDFKKYFSLIIYKMGKD